MRKNFELELYKNLKEFIAPAPQKVLLGLSGGPDSMALFHLFLNFYQKYPDKFQFSAAHVDHGWRVESADEALQLQALAENKGVNFFCCCLNPLSFEGNVEAFCREERLKFFKNLYDSHSFTALALGHHADDQAETIFKRVCEGSHFLEFSAMQQKSFLENMLVWRPLLPFRKKQVLEWLEAKKISSMEDPTNYDKKFLRSRLRQEILPSLSKQFGKDICQPLCRLGKETEEISIYFDEQIEPLAKLIAKGPLGAYIDLSEYSLAPIIFKYFVRFFTEKKISRDGLEKSYAAFINNQTDSSFPLIQSNYVLIIDKKRLFIVNKNIFSEDTNKKVDCLEKSFFWNSWKISITLSNAKIEKASFWPQLFQGDFSAQLFLDEQQFFSSPKYNLRRAEGEKSLQNHYNENNIPVFLRKLFPVICSEKGWERDFLSANCDFSVKNPTSTTKKMFLIKFDFLSS